MKATTRIDYAARIERAVDFLERTDPEDAPDLTAMAAAAALSPFHFHRIFRLMTGETVGEALKRIRLARAIPLIVEQGQAITQAAGASGYASSQSFARALRTATGASASEARADPDTGARLARLLGPSVAGDMPLEIRIVSVAPLRLIAMRNVGAYAELNHGYERLFEAVFVNVPLSALRGVHGIPHGDPRFEPDRDFVFDCAVDIGEALPPDGAFVLVADGGSHLSARHVGDYEALLPAIDHVYASALMEGLALADAPLRIHYVDTPEDAAPEALRSDIYLPLADIAS